MLASNKCLLFITGMILSTTSVSIFRIYITEDIVLVVNAMLTVACFVSVVLKTFQKDYKFINYFQNNLTIQNINLITKIFAQQKQANSL